MTAAATRIGRKSEPDPTPTTAVGMTSTARAASPLKAATSSPYCRVFFTTTSKS
jgi:hypothetical protein